MSNGLKPWQMIIDRYLVRKKRQIDTILRRAQKARNINIRINADELNMLKQRADKEGLPYQTLLSSILHKYLTDQLIEGDRVLTLLNMMKKKI